MRFLAMTLLGVIGGLLLGCEPAPTVEFATPRVMMHIDAPKIVDVEKIRGDITIEKMDDKHFRVLGTGVVRIELPPNMTYTHTVDVEANKIRVHGVDVENKGGTREVFMENKVLGGVHPDRVKK